MENATESRWNRDRFPTDFWSEFCQGVIPSGFRRNSVVIPSIISMESTEPGFSFLHVPSVLGCLGGDRVQKKNRVRRFILSMLNVRLFESKF